MGLEAGTEGEQGGRGPQTGHAVLTEGSIDCLTLSRRGLYTAGKACVHVTSISASCIYTHINCTFFMYMIH